MEFSYSTMPLIKLLLLPPFLCICYEIWFWQKQSKLCAGRLQTIIS